jgi:hypothetical protein
MHRAQVVRTSLALVSLAVAGCSAASPAASHRGGQADSVGMGHLRRLQRVPGPERQPAGRLPLILDERSFRAGRRVAQWRRRPPGLERRDR